MPDTPSRSDVHVNRPLTNISVAYMQDQEGFIARRAFPVINVDKQTDNYWIYDRGDFFRDEMQDREPGTESAGGSYRVSTDTYGCTVRAFHKDIPDQIRANADDQLDMDRDATEFVSLKALLRWERLFVANFMPNTHAPGTVWTFSVDGVASGATAAASFDPLNAANNDVLQWNDASSTPIEDVRRAKRYVQQLTGYRPNSFVLPQIVYDALVDHPDIVGRIDRGQTAGAASANLVTLADLFELDEVLVGGAVYNSAKQGATDVNNFVMGKNALLQYKPRRPSMLTPSAGYTFMWRGFIGSNNGVRISRIRSPLTKADRIEIETAHDHKKIGADLGYYFRAIVA